ncbi:T9SS type A sorting domain-containing protein [Flagellimonas allohymeniacidonis]|uniref:T9SS type A sorting domain-containing protein n=1 Tax=Flagellimonas allohymeniacidonis TaxID=2517819 RepID=A0A4Q8QH55_9FLAO|nr:T9SS type A sorting domain-containing protein [Allomuricauda hymeniacidonis]TAI47739.1 T9SS type A sorting domain-containing protein [Allomuricauda hymeniacidonis]
MKRPLLSKHLFSFIISFLLVLSSGLAQQLKRTHDDAPQKGHNLYKQSKLYDSKKGPVGAKPKAIGDRALDRLAYEARLLQDPVSKRIPDNILTKEAEFSDKIAPTNVQQEMSKTYGTEASKRRYFYWRGRGPANVGGRTRALALDMRNENTILAGGVSGGLWRSTDAGSSWRRVTRKWQSPSITAIAQDPRKNRQNVWYYASGERFGNSAGAPGAFYQGSGIFKSFNNGRSWIRMRNTTDNDVTSFSSFDLINSIIVHPKNGDVYAATFDGLFRSQDGARNFEEVLPSGFDSQTEVIVTPSGTLYATVDIFGNENAGFYTSEDGDTWTNITPEGIFPSYGRTIMAFDPSDENRVYFFSYDLSNFGEAFLWRYQADAATPEEQWVDLTANLPTNVGGIAGNLNLQGAYNMVIKVHPTNPDIVFVGGTNLYRSTTGFTTPTGFEGWIGGYTIFSNSFALYPNHHPDQHNLVFLPSNPNKAISANDGGVQVTEDITITSEPVTWTSLNNGYITTQPYAIAIDPEGNSQDIVAGFQDNGTWFTNSTNGNDPWESDFSGDGSYNAIADGGLTRYVSAQFGNVYRFNFNEAGEFISFTRVQPAGASGFDFVAPFVLDPINDNIMYMPAGDRMWRNNNLDEVPLFSNAPATVNWVQQTQTATPDGSVISGLDVSRFPVANRLYYGTSSGLIFKVENANLDDQTPVDISSGKGLPTGNINQIYVDPNNSDRVFAVFSNYNIVSVFMSKNAGETWESISGNLEENKDGTGNGPSVRWFSIGGNNNLYYAGTSTGLYVSFRLNGDRTRWFKEPFVVGNVVVPQIRTRSDGFVAVAAHGNGVYNARFYASKSPEASLSTAYLLPDITLPVNNPPIEVDVTDLFVSSKGKPISVELTNSNPNFVTAVLEDDTISLSFAPDVEGSAAIGLVATSGKEQVAEGFTVTLTEFPIYDQNGAVSSSSPSQTFLDFGGALAQSADDFIIPEGEQWTINNIIAFGGANNSPLLDNASVVVYQDNGGLPGAVVYDSGAFAPSSNPTDANLSLDLPEALVLESGTYWLSVYANLNFLPNQTQWFWLTQASLIGNEASFRDPADLFVTGAIDWTPQSVAFGGNPEDQIFQIFGTVNRAATGETALEIQPMGVPGEETGVPENLATLETEVITAVWPNPSSDSFYFALKNSENRTVSAQIFNMVGQMVYEEKNWDGSKPFVWNASNSTPGIYFVKIFGHNINENFKIIKR